MVNSPTTGNTMEWSEQLKHITGITIFLNFYRQLNLCSWYHMQKSIWSNLQSSNTLLCATRVEAVNKTYYSIYKLRPISWTSTGSQICCLNNQLLVVFVMQSAYLNSMICSLSQTLCFSSVSHRFRWKGKDIKN